MVKTTAYSVNLSLRVPEASREFAGEIRSHPPFTETPGYMLINYSSTVKLKFREEDFIALARAVYQTNDRRGAVKRQINLVLGSALIEEKGYKPY